LIPFEEGSEPPPLSMCEHNQKSILFNVIRYFKRSDQTQNKICLHFNQNVGILKDLGNKCFIFHLQLTYPTKCHLLICQYIFNGLSDFILPVSRSQNSNQGCRDLRQNTLLIQGYLHAYNDLMETIQSIFVSMLFALHQA
jgi:hypothetical protein